MAQDDVKVAMSPGRNEVLYWKQEFGAAVKREKKWKDLARTCVELYEAEVEEEAKSTFNILYSNTETLLPACYNSLPRPYCKRRFDDADPVGKAVSEVLNRGLKYFLDPPSGDYEAPHQLFKQAVVGALVPGRGITRWRYDPEFAPLAPVGQQAATEAQGAQKQEDSGAPDPSLADPDDENPGEVNEDNEVVADEPAADEKVASEWICGENVAYNRVLYGYARSWKGVPWAAYMHLMTRADVKENFGAAWVGKLTFRKPTLSELDGELEKKEKKDDGDGSAMGASGVCEVWEVWHKARKKVIFVCKDYADSIIKRVDAPLKLSGFFPQPQPLQFLLRTQSLTPTPLYKLYRKQAQELNRVSHRINRIVDALKVRGFYDGRLKGDLSTLMTKDDNTLIPAEGMAQFPEGFDIGRLLHILPIERLVAVLQQLYIAREQSKQVIYEITGISDILRGASVASETATAQNIKNQWGTLRLKNMQGLVQAYVCENLRIMAEIMADNFSQESLAAITGLDYATDKEIAAAQTVLQQAQQFATQAQAAAPQPGQPPQAQAPGGVPPQMVQAAQQAQQVLQKVKWSDVLKMLKDDVVRGYRIDIETNSTIDNDATEDKQGISEVLTAIGQLGQVMEPMIQQGLLPPTIFKQILITILRRYSFGKELEDQIQAMPDAAPPQNKQDPETQGKMQLMQMDVQVKQKEGQMKMALMDKEMQIKEQELALQAQELELKAKALQQRTAEQDATHQGKMQAISAKAQAAMMAATMTGQPQGPTVAQAQPTGPVGVM